MHISDTWGSGWRHDTVMMKTEDHWNHSSLRHGPRPHPRHLRAALPHQDPRGGPEGYQGCGQVGSVWFGNPRVWVLLFWREQNCPARNEFDVSAAGMTCVRKCVQVMWHVTRDSVVTRDTWPCRTEIARTRGSCVCVMGSVGCPASGQLQR